MIYTLQKNYLCIALTPIFSLKTYDKTRTIVEYILYCRKNIVIPLYTLDFNQKMELTSGNVSFAGDHVFYLFKVFFLILAFF